jgi:hypothetical protein
MQASSHYLSKVTREPAGGAEGVRRWPRQCQSCDTDYASKAYTRHGGVLPRVHRVPVCVGLRGESSSHQFMLSEAPHDGVTGFASEDYIVCLCITPSPLSEDFVR